MRVDNVYNFFLKIIFHTNQHHFNTVFILVIFIAIILFSLF